MHTLTDEPNSYRVEVSGWNVKGIFFVEKAMLFWTAEEEKSVELMSRLQKGCVVFVRLAQTAVGDASFPVAYRVLSIASEDSAGRGRVSLRQLRPNMDGEQPTIGTNGSASKLVEGQKVFSN